jgi:hypothetical protein
MRLKVRQWTTLLVDHSLLLGSSSKGVHLHDIALTFLRDSHSPLEYRALQTAVVEELVKMSTARSFEDTGSTSEAFAGEEVDWYVCNIGNFHIKQSMDPAVPVIDNEDVKRWLVVDDAVLVRQVALAVSVAELEVLATHYTDQRQWFKAAKAKWAGHFFIADKLLAVAALEETLELLENYGSVRTNEALQLELDTIGTSSYNSYLGNPKMVKGSKEEAHVQARLAELNQNPSLRVNPMALITVSGILCSDTFHRHIFCFTGCVLAKNFKAGWSICNLDR